MSEFIRPQVQVEEINETSARVSVEPLERGYGDTLGNSLRRVLLSSLEGAAVEAIQIDGAQHEFMTIPNMVEDVTDIVLNVKGLVFRLSARPTRRPPPSRLTAPARSPVRTSLFRPSLSWSTPSSTLLRSPRVAISP